MCPPGSSGRRVSSLMLCIGICTVPYIIPLVLYDMMRDDYRSWRDRAPPKVIRRKRALSLSRKNDTKPPLRGRTATQTKSLFFKLPAELRMMVYEELVGKGEIHLAVPYCKKDGWKVRSYRCLCPLPTEESGQKVYIHLPNTESHDSGRSNLGVMGLLQSCRSIYSEAIDVLYQAPMFVLPDYYLIFAFLSSILPQRLNAIRSLRIQQRGFYKHADIDYFRRRKVYSPVLSSRKVPLREPSSFRLAAEIVCKMPGLQELHMDMCFEGYFTPEPNSFRRSQESVVVDVFAPVLEMLQLKVLEGVEVMVTFDQLPVEGAHWIDLPFVQAEVEDM